MTGRDVPPSPAWQTAVLIAGFVVGASFAIWLVSSEWLTTRAALTAARPVVDVSPSSAIGVPLAVAFLCFLALPLLPKADPPRTRNGFLRTTKVQNGVFTVALACMPLTFLATPVGRVVMSDVMTDHGYRTCRHPDWPRGPTRWVRAAVPCPGAKD